MTRKGFLSVFALVFCLMVLSGCQRAEVDTNRSAPAANTNAGRETVDTASIETELMRIETDWPRVLKEKDVAAVARVEADDAVFVYPDGTLGGKSQDIKDIESGALTAESWEVTDLKVIVLNNDAALVNGRSIVKNGKYKTPAGKSIDISGQYRFIDTFARRSGEWKLVAGASTPVREPVASASPSPATTASPAAKPSPAAGAPPTPKVSPSPRITPSPRATPSPRVTPTPRTTPMPPQ
jgi:ketosteroid isomerase-like protein